MLLRVNRKSPCKFIVAASLDAWLVGERVGQCLFKTRYLVASTGCIPLYRL